jgi:hypothetical protein
MEPEFITGNDLLFFFQLLTRNINDLQNIRVLLTRNINDLQKATPTCLGQKAMLLLLLTRNINDLQNIRVLKHTLKACLAYIC